MVNSGKRSGPGTLATLSKEKRNVEQEKEMLRSEFEVMQKLDFVFIKEIGASNAEEYEERIVEIITMEFLPEENSEENDQ